MDIDDWMIKKIPIQCDKKSGVFDDDEEHNGHSQYIGCGLRKNEGDYWDAYCLSERGTKPPNKFSQFLKWVDNPTEVIKWKEKYKFNMIICFCHCCYSAVPIIVYGWSSYYSSDNEEDDDSFSESLSDDMLENWTPDSSCHGFHIKGDDLIYFGGKNKLKD